MPSTERSTHWGPCTQFGVKAFPEQRAIAEQRGWKIDGQEETCPTTGRKHFQFWVKTPQVRMSEVMKVFQGAHIEPARNVEAVKNYCQKEETRSGNLPQASDKYPSQDKLFDLFSRWAWRAFKNNKRSYPRDGDAWLKLFDECCDTLIRDGYRVESLAVNPAVRSCIKKFGPAIYERHISAKFLSEDETDCAVDRQTDRQAEIISVPVITTIDAGRSNEDTAPENESDASSRTESCEDYQDCDGASSSGYTQSTDADRSEASDGTSNTE